MDNAKCRKVGPSGPCAKKSRVTQRVLWCRPCSRLRVVSFLSWLVHLERVFVAWQLDHHNQVQDSLQRDLYRLLRLPPLRLQVFGPSCVILHGLETFPAAGGQGHCYSLQCTP